MYRPLLPLMQMLISKNHQNKECCALRVGGRGRGPGWLNAPAEIPFSNPRRVVSFSYLPIGPAS